MSTQQGLRVGISPFPFSPPIYLYHLYYSPPLPYFSLHHPTLNAGDQLPGRTAIKPIITATAMLYTVAFMSHARLWRSVHTPFHNSIAGTAKIKALYYIQYNTPYGMVGSIILGSMVG